MAPDLRNSRRGAHPGQTSKSLAARDADQHDRHDEPDRVIARIGSGGKDGRVIDLKASVDPPRPKVALIGKSVQPSPSSSDSNIALSNPDELPEDATLTFSVQSQIPAAFSHDETIEVATAEE